MAGGERLIAASGSREHQADVFDGRGGAAVNGRRNQITVELTEGGKSEAFGRIAWRSDCLRMISRSVKTWSGPITAAVLNDPAIDGFQDQSHRPVVCHLHLHVGSEDSGGHGDSMEPDLFGHLLNEWRGPIRSSGVHE